MTWKSIAGETPIDDLSGLKVPGITTRAQLNLHEAENIRKATVNYLASRPPVRRAPFTVAWMLQVHEQMFGDVWEWAGTPRRTQKNLGVPAYQILDELKKLEDDIAFWTANQTMTPAEVSARIHHRGVFIHPFENGNGRWARMLANVWLRREGHSLVRWPEKTIGDVSVERETYLTAIRAADHGDLRELIDLHERWSG
ncbi:mobile mystery protein B [Myxococcota bacterium]